MFINTSFKFRKNHFYFIKNFAATQKVLTTQKQSLDRLDFRSYRANSIKACEYSAIRRLLGRKTEKLFRFVVKRKPDVMVTAKPREIRMGKGKGAFSHVQLPSRVGSSIFTLSWCHRLATYPFLFSVKKAIKKSGLSLHY